MKSGGTNMNPAKDYNEKSISIQELFVLMKRYLALIIVVGILSGIAMYCVCKFLVSPVYEASAKMIVNSRQEQTGTVTNDQITSSQKLVETYAIIIRSRPVLEPVIENLDFSISIEKLASMVTVTPVNDTQVMQIAVRSKNPAQALQIVEQIVEVCPAIIIEAVEAGSVKTIEPAYLKASPVAPNTNLFVVIAMLLSMVIVVIVVILRFVLDNTYKSEADLRNDLNLPVLGVIPDYQKCLKQKKDGKEANYYG
jgi:capsular polysaccharide biosynthesis protein